MAKTLVHDDDEAGEIYWKVHWKSEAGGRLAVP
jgi:hypothetical protein